MRHLIQLNSKIDESVNFVFTDEEGMISECRYVRREPESIICYLSSHSGCNRGCKFCHLTITKQTSFRSANSVNMLDQADAVLKYYHSLPKEEKTALYIDFSWMARGEALANVVMTYIFPKMRQSLAQLVTYYNIKYDTRMYPRYKISTIFPYQSSLNFHANDFLFHDTYFYYSLYSMSEDFRKKWMPGADYPGVALNAFSRLQEAGGNKLTLHQTYIHGENDSLDDVHKMIEWIKIYKLDVRFNLVRYNPYSSEYGRESDEEVIERNLNLLRQAFGNENVKSVTRVGLDVYASCGMFYNKG